jgi:hypothetical protein
MTIIRIRVTKGGGSSLALHAPVGELAVVEELDGLREADAVVEELRQAEAGFLRVVTTSPSVEARISEGLIVTDLHQLLERPRAVFEDDEDRRVVTADPDSGTRGHRKGVPASSMAKNSRLPEEGDDVRVLEHAQEQDLPLKLLHLAEVPYRARYKHEPVGASGGDGCAGTGLTYLWLSSALAAMTTLLKRPEHKPDIS